MDAKDQEPPSAKALDDGYNQTYMILSKDHAHPSATPEEGNEVLFRCGNWCYKGLVQFNGLRFNTEEIPVLIPTLQRQQGSLRYYCTSKSVPRESPYHGPMQYMEEALEFIAKEITSEAVDRELRKMASVFPWIDDDSAATYFELSIGELPECMKHVSLVASKTYTRGLIIISIYFDRCVYCLIQGGEGDQPLLDVRFPDVSKHGQGLHINSYSDQDNGYKKLTLWHILDTDAFAIRKDLPKLKTLNVSSKNYEQTYCILKSAVDSKTNNLSVYHDALFRFGSWCYSGRVQLTPTLNLQDVPYVIPALRMQQSRLDFYCDVNQVPTTSPFAAALEYVKRVTPSIETNILSSEEMLKGLIDRLTNMGLGDAVTKWLEGDPANSFYEFKLSPDRELAEKLSNTEMIVSKCYYPSGIITILIIFQFTAYVSVLESNGENPLLDSRFPDVSGKGRGYQLVACNDGTADWPELRKVSIWQTITALEQEFRDKAAQYAQAKRDRDLEGEDEEAEEAGEKGRPTEKEQPSDEKVSAVAVVAHEGKLSPETETPKAEDKQSPGKAESKTGEKSIASPMSIDPLLRPKQSLPHHLPKMNSLSNKLDDIRKNLGDTGLKAPWDSKGKPLTLASDSAPLHK